MLSKIISPFHGELSQQPDKHLDGSECQTCGKEKTKQKKRDD